MLLADLASIKHREFEKIRFDLDRLHQILYGLPDHFNGRFIQYVEILPNTGFAEATITLIAPDREGAAFLLEHFGYVPLHLDSSSQTPFTPNTSGEPMNAGTEIFPARLVYEPQTGSLFLHWFTYLRKIQKFIEIKCAIEQDTVNVWNEGTETVIEDFPADCRVIRQGEGVYQTFVAFWNLPVDNFRSVFLKKKRMKISNS